VIRGFGSTTDKYAIAVQVKELQSRDHCVRILHYGDFDPSGEKIFEDLIDKVTKIGGQIGVDPERLQFEKVAVNPVDIVRLNLPPEPAEEKSTNIREWWSRRIKRLTTPGDELYDPYAVELVGKLKNPNNTESIQVELDALTAVNPEYLEKLTLNKLREVFDWNIYESLTRPKVEEVYERRGEVLRKLRATYRSYSRAWTSTSDMPPGGGPRRPPSRPEPLPQHVLHPEPALQHSGGRSCSTSGG
jgi:hypothetical protein